MTTRPDANAILIGLRGSGKSTVGRLLAAAMSREFVDLDRVTPGMVGASSAAEALRTMGEPAFRAAEMAALDQVLGVLGRVVALGGGTPTAPGAADRLRSERGAGTVWIAYLRASPDVLRARVASENLDDRPALLPGADPLGEIPRVHAARDPLYRELADIVLEVDGLTADEATTTLVGAFGRRA